MPIKVLFVCLGNICRSPMAEAIFQKMVNEAGLSDKIDVDSAGTGSWHVGEKAHPGTRRVLAQQGIPYNGRSRQVRSDELTRNKSYIVAMDETNLADLRRLAGASGAVSGAVPQFYRLLDFAEQSELLNVPDPYYTNNFEYVYQLVEDGCRGLLAMIRDREAV